MQINKWKIASSVILFAMLANADLSKQNAMQIAQQEITNIVTISPSGKWTTATVISDAFPVYIDGIASVSYYECKAITGTVDAGYVLVNVNKTDIIIPESATTGTTLREQYRAKLGNDNFMVCRYDDFCSAALDPTSKTVLSTIGFISPKTTGLGKTTADAINSSFLQYRAAVQQNGCNPDYNPTDIKKYYSDSVKSALGKVAAVSTDFSELKNNLYCSDYGNIHTPAWQQFKKSDGNFIGCGPTAWAIVYGYWKQFRSKDKLFPGLSNLISNYCWNDYNYSSINSVLSDCMNKCYSAMGTFNVPFSDQSATLPSSMPNGSNYARDLGYDISCYSTSNPSNYDDIKASINDDRPVILLTGEGFWAQAVGFPSHYVVIEKYIRYNKDVLWGAISYPSSIRYYCNYGGGNSWKWVYALDMGTMQAYNKCQGSTFITINNFQTINFYANVLNGKAPLTVKFTPINNTGYPLRVMRWEFGDINGSGDNTWTSPTGVTATVTHTYTKPGIYSVTCKAAEFGGTGWPYTCPKNGYIRVYSDITPIVQLLLSD